MLIYHQFPPCARYQLKLLLQWRSGRFFVWTWRGLFFAKISFQMFFFSKSRKFFFFKTHGEICDFQKCFEGSGYWSWYWYKRAHLRGEHGIIIMSQRERHPILRLVYMDVSENRGTPKSSILGYPYFWKHPYIFLSDLAFLLRPRRNNLQRSGGFLSTKAGQVWLIRVAHFVVFFWCFLMFETLEPFGSQQKPLDDLRRFLFFAWKFKKSLWTTCSKNILMGFFCLGEKNKLNDTAGVSSNYLFAFNPRLERDEGSERSHMIFHQAAPEAAPVAAEVEITAGGNVFFFCFFVKPGRCVFFLVMKKKQLLLTVNCWFGLVGGLRF